MKRQHVSYAEGGAEENKLQGHTQGPEAALQICPPPLRNIRITFLLQEM